MEGFWLGPYGVGVPESVKRIPSKHEPNSLSKEGWETDMPIWKILMQDQYREKYAELRDDGYYWYKTEEKPEKKNENDFWLGPYDIRVDGSIDAIQATDETNTIYKNGTQTHLPYQKRLSRTEYLEKYTEKRNDGQHWYTLKPEGFWLGPFNVRVPNSIDRVPSRNEPNIWIKGAYETRMTAENILTREEYLAKYAELRDDGYYWYKG